MWKPDWRGQAQLPDRVRVTVRDGVTGEVLAVSRAATVHVNAPADCVRAKSPGACTLGATPDADRRSRMPTRKRSSSKVLHGMA